MFPVLFRNKNASGFFTSFDSSMKKSNEDLNVDGLQILIGCVLFHGTYFDLIFKC